MHTNSISLFFLLFVVSIFSQKTYTGIVLDKKTLTPIEFVDVFNNANFTITNEDGKFDFTSSYDSIKFNFLGYKTLKKTIGGLPKNGVIYLEPKAFELDEVFISDKNSIFKKMAATIKDDFTNQSYNEEFFLRTILKRNDSIIKIQDLNGVVNRKTLFSTTKNPMPKKNYTVYINNMRKAGYIEEGVLFKLFGFNELLTNFVRISASPKFFNFKKTRLEDASLIKLDFTPKVTTNNFTGHYIISSSDFSLSKVFWIDNNTRDFTVKKNIKYRTIKNVLAVHFFKEKVTDKYRIDNAKSRTIVEVFDNKNKRIVYDVTYIYKTAKVYSENKKGENKASIKKDIFKIKHPYEKEYWENSQHLKLTDEMIDFLNTLDKTNYKTVTNFKK